MSRTGSGRAPGGILGLGRTLIAVSILIILVAFFMVSAAPQTQIVAIALGCLLLAVGVALIILHFQRSKGGGQPPLQ